MSYMCHYCGSSEKEMRPYGPNGAMVCFACATATPERESKTSTMFLMQLDASGPEVIIGEETGPRPFNKSRESQS